MKIKETFFVVNLIISFDIKSIFAQDNMNTYKCWNDQQVSGITKFFNSKERLINVKKFKDTNIKNNQLEMEEFLSYVKNTKGITPCPEDIKILNTHMKVLSSCFQKNDLDLNIIN